MLGWKGPGTNFSLDFAALRVETNVLRISAKVLVPRAGPLADCVDAQRACAEPAVQLLCRALRLAPKNYRRFELAPDPDKPLMIGVYLKLRCGLQETEPDIESAVFHDIAGLAAAMQQFAAGEELSVALSPDWQTVIVRRAGTELPCFLTSS